MSKTPETLATALLAAQKALPSVGKDSKNSFHHYAYTSAEGMISSCREALHNAGLTLRRAGWKFDGTPEGGLVHSQFILAHGVSGESATDEVTWICVPEKGRPLDKALAGALTSSLGYYLRDLLLVPREDESEMDRRDDTKYEPRKSAPAPARTTRSDYATPTRTDSGNAPARQAAQEAPRSAPTAPPATATPNQSGSSSAAPASYTEVMASRPAKDCAWHAEWRVVKVGQGKATSNGSTRYPILFNTGSQEEWASCFDSDLMQAAQNALAGHSVDAFVQSGKFGLTLYGLRVPVQSDAPESAQQEDGIPF